MYVNSDRQGKGSYHFANGDRYDGDFERNMRWGEIGTYLWTNGDMYTGQWVNDRKNGCGTFYWRNGDKYIGEFENDLRHGFGTYIKVVNGSIQNCPNCTTYAGEWKNGLKHGTGRCYDFAGRLIYEGPFENDKPTGKYPYGIFR
jgi:hypothetical protein